GPRPTRATAARPDAHWAWPKRALGHDGAAERSEARLPVCGEREPLDGGPYVGGEVFGRVGLTSGRRDGEPERVAGRSPLRPMADTGAGEHMAQLVNRGAGKLDVALLAGCGHFDKLMRGAVRPRRVVADTAVLAGARPIDQLGVQESLPHGGRGAGGDN